MQSCSHASMRLTLQNSHHSTTHQSPLTIYRTGDLARWHPDGNIEFLGRMDHQVKIRGFRVELGEIESQLLTHEEIKETVVMFKTDQKGDKFLCAYVVAQKELDIAELRRFLSGKLPDYMLPGYFVPLASIPLTPNGKVDRKALPEPGINLDQSHIAPKNKIEKKLVEIWCEVLSLEKEKISIEANFFELGGHSLNATVMIARIQRELNVKLPLAEIFKTPNIKALSRYIQNSEKEKYTAIEPTEKKEYYALSSAQKRLYILQQMDLESTAYNIPQVIPLGTGREVKEKKLEQVIYRLMTRQESFRTSLREVDKTPVQRIHETDQMEFNIEYYYLDGSPGEKKTSSNLIDTIFKKFVRPFNLSQAPLVRVGLLYTSPLRQPSQEENFQDKYILMVDMHHIISDMISQDVLDQEFTTLMLDRELSPLRIQYKDFAQWQNSETIIKSLKRQEEYWLKEYKGDIPLLNLPLDYERGKVIDFVGEAVSFTIDDMLTARVRELSNQSGVTLMMLLFSLYKILLARYAGQQELVVGTVAAGRQHADLENIIGFFVNMLPIKTKPHPDKTFSQYLAELKQKTVNAYENQGYPFEELVARLDIPREPGRHPLVDAVFSFQSPVEDVSNSTETSREVSDFTRFNITHFDLMLTAVDTGKTIQMSIEYGAVLFKKSTIFEFSNFYQYILKQVTANPDLRLRDIQLHHTPRSSSSKFIKEGKNDWEL